MNSELRHLEFVRLFSQHARRLHAAIYSLLPNWADADDIFQETSRVLWEKFSSYQSGSDFYAWACRVAQFEVLTFRQRQARSRVTFSEDFVRAVAEAAELESELLTAQQRALALCVEKLPPDERRLLLLRYGNLTTTQQLAAELGRSAEGLYKSLQRTRQRLVKCIERTLRMEGFE